jgi:hypothetical protein
MPRLHCPGEYYHYDFQPVSVAAKEVRDYNFTWSAPNVPGAYFVEVGLVPAQLTAYDAAWLNVSRIEPYLILRSDF